MTNKQIFLVFSIIAVAGSLLILTFLYWYADTLYAKGKGLNAGGVPEKAEKMLLRAIAFSPSEPYFHLELADTYVKLEKTEYAEREIQKALALSPVNVNLKKAAFSTFLRLSVINPGYISKALSIIRETIPMAPTDAKLFYNLGLTLARIGDGEGAIQIMEKTISLKPNYKEPRLALAYLLIEKKQFNQAKDQLDYILKNIDPNDDRVKKTLEEIR